MLKKNKDIDKIWHADSTLVFKSSKEKISYWSLSKWCFNTFR